ncbi:TRAP transporter substrate-binding protein DctP [Zobellella maritima]|uniref:TRAP transporter substrate-binding protein DctP n=1 Tax=Zobellella maritima TaxID=2059725 RepID=UPI0018E58743|nr:TRAP transporter substrate-binding protein DctP [Zobellella maritima]
MEILKKMKFGIRAITLVVCAGAAVLSTQTMASNDSFKLRLATVEGDKSSPIGKSMELWADLIKEKSGGRIKTNIYYQGELGSQQEMFDQLVKGNIDMMITWPQTSYDQRLGINNLPYLVLDWENALKAYGKDGWLRKAIDPIYNEVGLKYFGPYPEGFGGIATKDVQASTIEEARGIKIRSQTFFPLPQTVNALGYQAIPIDWNEVYTSLQTGVVDGDGSNVIYWDYEYFGDLLTHYTHTKHNFSAAALIMSQESWGKLDEEDRRIIESAAEVVITKQFENGRAEEEKWIAKAQEGGMKYIDLQGTQLNDLVSRVREEIWPQAEKSFGPEVMETIRTNALLPQ